MVSDVEHAGPGWVQGRSMPTARITQADPDPKVICGQLARLHRVADPFIIPCYHQVCRKAD
jgi:hypothetical protein